MLGYGLIFADRPRVERTHGCHRCLLRRGSGLFLAGARKHKSGINARQKRLAREGRSQAAVRSLLRSFTPTRYARLRERAEQGVQVQAWPFGQGTRWSFGSFAHWIQHIRVARSATLGQLFIGDVQP